MLIATIYALIAASLHATWNLFAKRSSDPFLALCSQFMVSGCASGLILLATGGIPAGAWQWAVMSGLFHMPYLIGLGWAYRHGDFSLAYPIARGGGALISAIGGIMLLDDELRTFSGVAICIVIVGMSLLAFGAPKNQVAVALLVAVSIAGYTIVDSHAARVFDVRYAFAAFVVIGVCAAVTVLFGRRGPDLAVFAKHNWRKSVFTSSISMLTYCLVLLAVRTAPVGYVAVLRESSVLIAVLVGWRMLDERTGAIRMAAAAVMVTGLTLLVIAG